MRKGKLTGYVLLFVCIAGVTIYSAMKKTRSVQRDIPTLLNFYYTNKDKNSLKAKEALDLILKQDPSNVIAIHAMGHWFIQQGDTHSALIFLQKNHALYPQDAHIELELAKLYIMLNQTNQAKPILKKLLTSDSPDLKKKSIILYQALYPQETIQSTSINYASFIEPIHIKTIQDLSPLYAKVQEIVKLQPESARNYLHLIISMAPHEKEAYVKLGYLELQQNNADIALHYFLKAFAIKEDAQLAVQIGYIYAQKRDRAQALFFFNYGALHGNLVLKQQSLKALAFLKENPVETQITPRRDFIEPIHIKTKQDLSPLYAKVQELIKLQPDSARNYLHLIISMAPNEKEAYMKLGYLELQQNNADIALHYFLKAFAIKADAQLAVQIGYIYAKKRDRVQALFFFNYGALNGNLVLKQQSLKALAYLEENPVETQPYKSSFITLSPEDKLWNLFYQNKQNQPAIALEAITNLLQMHPNDIRTLKEAAYFAMAQKNFNRAIELWNHAYSLERNPEYALSIAYLYDAQNKKPQAFHFFDLASKTRDMSIKTKAELAMTAMGGSQFQFLPKPFFAEFYSAPFYFSRFDLGVLPTITRAGMTVNENHHTDAYTSWRRTKDNRSGTVQGLIIQNSISQIFEDNVAIYAAGLRTFPLPKIPLQIFVEIGRAEDLVYRNRAKWRSDVRGGLVYYNAWGEKPTWTKGLAFPWKWVSTLYADTIYYSRYNNNIIGTAWFRPGLRVATFQSASLDFYLANYLILDKNREFFNNVYSLGPGMVFQPSNRINIVLRLEALQGYYIPVNSPTPNPYRSKYYNNLAMVEVYFRF